MTSTASSSCAIRVGAGGQRSPKMCSLSASPVPTPHEKRPSKRLATVAVAWARMPGWMRMIGQVTPTVTSIDDVRSAIAPSTDQTNGECPCASIHGWKWSEMDAKSKPWSSAMPARSTRRRGGCSSLESVSPNFVGAMVRVTPPAGSA